MRWLFVYTLVIISCPLFGQADTLMQEEITPILISESKIIERGRDLTHEQLIGLADLGEALTKQSSNYIKSYGLGSLSTISIWGGNANQNLLTWEGIPITNPMLGLSDLSLITMYNNQDVTISKGGASASQGSGAMTGVLALKNELNYGPRLHNVTLDLLGGSFGRHGGNLDLEKRGERFSYQLRLFHKQAHNKFLYQETKIQSNADFSLSGMTFTSGYKLNGHNSFRIDSWLQESEKGIPPTSTQNTSVARQEDLTKKIKLCWHRERNKLKSQMHVAFIDEDNNYSDALNLIEAENRFQTITHGGQLTTYKKNTFVTIKYDLTTINGFSKSYEDSKQQLNIASVYADIKQVRNNFILQASLRKEWRDFALPPLIPLLSLSYKTGSLTTKLKLSREYRAPTLNELFWVPGGNNLLSPEEGWNKELWFTTENERHQLSASATIFHRSIKNWIIWAPLNGQQLWSAYNLGQVSSYGVDAQVKKLFDFSDWLACISIGGSYTRSENLINNDLPRIAKGDQLIYTPLWNGFMNFTAAKNKINTASQLRYTSAAKGINEDLNPYLLVSMQIGYEFPIRSITNNLEINIENVLNTEYRVIERRPMPGRYYNLKWTLKFKKQ